MVQRATRRDVLRRALVAGLASPLLLGRGAAAAGEEKVPAVGGGRSTPAPTSPGRDHPALERMALGLMALSQAHTRHWARGHHGAAVIAATCFGEENDLDERAARALRAQVEAFVRFRRSEFPAPDPGPGTADPARIVEQLDKHVSELRSGGHDAIYAALALRALRDLPAYRTPKIVDGVCKLLQTFVAAVPAEAPTRQDVEQPPAPYADARDVARTTLGALLRPWSQLEEVGTGVVVHWVTHADALITLEELGHTEVARRGHAAHQRYLRRAASDVEHPEPEATFDWLSAAYWESDAPRRLQKGSWFFGHSFKLPYSVYRLLRHADDEPRRPACLERASRLAVPFH